LFGVDETDNLYETSVIVCDVGHGIKASDCSSFGVVVVRVRVRVAVVAVVAVGVVVFWW
jgi:hypothetical protein